MTRTVIFHSDRFGPLRPARGILTGLAISIAVYTVIILAWRFL